MKKLTARHLAVFSKAVRHWQMKLALNGWEIQVMWAADKDAYAYVASNANNRCADIKLCREWPATYLDPTDLELEKIAFHELMHIVLADLANAANRNVPEASAHLLDGVEHAVIRTMENILFPPK